MITLKVFMARPAHLYNNAHIFNPDHKIRIELAQRKMETPKIITSSMNDLKHRNGCSRTLRINKTSLMNKL